MDKLYEYKRLGFRLEVYPNRIAIEDSTGKAGFIAPDKIDILLKDISGLNVKGWSRSLELTMRDGSFRKIPIFGKNSEKLRKVVLELM